MEMTAPPPRKTGDGSQSDHVQFVEFDPYSAAMEGVPTAPLRHPLLPRTTVNYPPFPSPSRDAYNIVCPLGRRQIPPFPPTFTISRRSAPGNFYHPKTSHTRASVGSLAIRIRRAPTPIAFSPVPSCSPVSAFRMMSAIAPASGTRLLVCPVPSTSYARTGCVPFLTSHGRYRVPSYTFYVGIGLIQVHLYLSGATRSEPVSLGSDPEEINAVNRGGNT